jgi:hypothetical protein
MSCRQSRPAAAAVPAVCCMGSCNRRARRSWPRDRSPVDRQPRRPR